MNILVKILNLLSAVLNLLSAVKIGRYCLAALLAMTCISQSPAFADINLVFGTYAADKPTETVRKFKPFLEYLSKEMTRELGEPVVIRMKIAPKYNQGISDLTEGRVDISRFGPASYVTAKDLNRNIRIVAMESKAGAKTFKGIIAVHSDSDFKELKDLKGHSFAFGDPLSTIGRYLAQAQLLDAGISSDDLKEFGYLGRHDRVGTAVGNRDFDAGALKESTFEKLMAKDVPIRKLVAFDNVTKPWIASSDTPPRIYNALRMAMLSANDLQVLKSISKSGFLPGDDRDFDIIRAAIKRSALFE